MASSSSDAPRIKYDVFISFRGEDIRDNFLSHLKKEMLSKQVDFFVDEEKLHPGDEISSTLLKAIEESSISLVIFSKNYASSRWCMEELVKIIECMKQYQRIVIPVFHNIDPSDVRHQKRTFAEAFDVHKQKYEEENMENWRFVLKEAANLSGIHYPSNYRNESEFIEAIVKDISEKLSHQFSIASEGLVGIDENLKLIEPLLAIESNHEVRIVGIWGMGGIGKTTIAKAVFDRYASQYEGCCLLQNVREESQKSSPHYLYEKLVSELLEGENLLVKGSAQARSMYVRKRLSRKKVLIVLDDVDTSDKLDYLTREQICLGEGSRVIVTTRDEQILIASRVHGIYMVQELSFKSSLELFCLKAFHKRYPENGYEKLSQIAVHYAKGIPLALKVLGSFLCSRSVVAWESALGKLRIHPDPSIFNVLKLSYDGLDDSDKNIFLDIAFFFKGENKDNVVRFHNSCDFFADIGINNLERKALITISNHRIEMHDLIQQMGTEIVRRESDKDPQKLTRINKLEDFHKLLKNSEEKSLVEGIMINLSEAKNLHLNANTFRNMPRLRFLKLHSHWGERSWNVIVPTTLEKFSDELRYLAWPKYPLSYLPSPFCAEKLVELHMPHSQVTKLWDGVQDLVNLKTINLSKCKQLVELPDLSKATNLERIDISDCEALCQLHPSIISSPALENLILDGCKELMSIKGEIHSKSLKVLYFGGCSSLEEFSVSSMQLSSLDLNSSRIRILGNELCSLTCLQNLELFDCRELTELPHNMKALSRLQTLNVSGCRSLRSIPELPLSTMRVCAANCSSLETIFSIKAVFCMRWILLKNCMRLDEESLNIIIEDAHDTILRKILLMQAENGNLWDSNDIEKRFSCDVCYPGSKVPEWFRFRTTEGASITVEIDEPHSQLLGFCVSCVVSQEFSPYYNVYCEYDLGDGEKYLLGSYYLGNRWNSDHVFLWFHPFYNSRIMSSIERFLGSDGHATTWKKTILFTFTGEELTSRQEHFFIKGCGVLPIYASDILISFQNWNRSST